MKPKLKDIAAKAQVSITTVSMVLSGKGRISESVRKLVFDTAEELGYRRKSVVKSPMNQSDTNGTIGIIVSIDEDWAFIWAFIRPIIEELEQSFNKDGRNTILIPILHDSPVDEIINKVIISQIDAVISLHYGNEQFLSTLERMSIPSILVMNNHFQDRFYSVLVDDIQCAYEGTMHLVNLGHKNLAYVECERQDLPVLLNDRFFGFRKAIEESGIMVPQDQIVRFELNNIETLRTQLSKLFRKAREGSPTGIFCLDDDIAMRVINVLSELDIRVPEDVSIIAPGDVLDYKQSYIPQITTMRINTSYMGKIIYQMLINIMDHKPEDLHVLKVKHQLVKRGTCAPPRSEG